MISVDRKAKDIEEVVAEVLKRKDSIRTFVVVTFDRVGAAQINYSASWHDLGITASLCQSEFHRCYEGEIV